jgi:hypothetical protein
MKSKTVEQIVTEFIGKQYVNDFLAFLEFSNYYSIALAFEEWKGRKIAGMIGQGIKVETKEEQQPFYFKVMGIEGSKVVGFDEERQNISIEIADILGVRE